MMSAPAAFTAKTRPAKPSLGGVGVGVGVGGVGVGGAGGVGAGSLSRIVIVADRSARVARRGAERFTKNRSVGSGTRSPRIAIGSTLVVLPAGKVSVPDRAT